MHTPFNSRAAKRILGAALGDQLLGSCAIRNHGLASVANHLKPPSITMALLPPQDNFADLREVAEKLLKTTTDGNVKRLAEVVGRLAYRCDLLEREVERLDRATGSKKP